MDGLFNWIDLKADWLIQQINDRQVEAQTPTKEQIQLERLKTYQLLGLNSSSSKQKEQRRARRNVIGNEVEFKVAKQSDLTESNTCTGVCFRMLERKVKEE